MIEIVQMVEKIQISKNPEPMPVQSAAEPQGKFKKTGKLVYSALANISQIVHALHSPKTKTR